MAPQKKLTPQEADPHPELAHCRQTVEEVLQLNRKHAAAVAGRLSHDQVEAVLAADGDAAKVQKAVEEPKPPPPKKDNKPKTESKTAKK